MYKSARPQHAKDERSWFDRLTTNGLYAPLVAGVIIKRHGSGNRGTRLDFSNRPRSMATRRDEG